MKHFAKYIIVFLTIPAALAYSQQTILLHNGVEDIASMQCNKSDIYDASEVRRSPLFDNAPFLRIRNGDKLIKAKKRNTGKPLARPDEFYYYLVSGDKYFQLWTQDDAGKLLLSSAFYGAENCLLFDWDFSMENAKALRQLLPNQYCGSLSMAQYLSITKSVQKAFPEIRHLRSIDLQSDRVIPIPGQEFVEFQGLVFDDFRNCIYRYALNIGPHICMIKGLELLKGPRHVRREEFERVDLDGPNGCPGQDVDPATAKLKKAEYDRMVEFKKLVTDVIHPKANSQ